MAAASYGEVLARFLRAVAAGEDAGPALWSWTPPDEPHRELELVGAMIYPRREIHLFAVDPGLDSRRALRGPAARAISLTNYLNFAGPGTRGVRRPIAFWAVPPSGAAEVATRFELDADHLILAHDFRTTNPAAASLRSETPFWQHALFWLDDGSCLSGRVYNLEQVLMRAEEATFFFSVCDPAFYGHAAARPWGRGLPYLALNRRYVVAKKLAPTLEELEVFLALDPGLQPAGFAPAQLIRWEALPEEVRRAAEVVAAARDRGGAGARPAHS